MSIMGRWHLTKRPLVQYDSNQRATKHDDSGQVFTEVTCKGSPMIADWVWKTKGSSREAGRFRSIGPGCASLVNMAIRKVLKHSYDITPDSLRGLPWSIGKVLWQSVVASYVEVRCNLSMMAKVTFRIDSWTVSRSGRPLQQRTATSSMPLSNEDIM